MCEPKKIEPSESPDRFMDSETFKSCFARSVAVNSLHKQSKNSGDLPGIEEIRDGFNSLQLPQEMPVRYRKNNRSASMDDSRRFSCGSIVSRRASMALPPKQTDVTMESIYSQHKIDTLQWQLKEAEKSREMYKATMKEVVNFLEKAHVSLEHLGHRLNQKNPVPRSKSELQTVLDCEEGTQNRKNSMDWNPNKKPDNHPDEIPPEKLSQEAFRLLRTAQSLLSTQEPSLASSENVNGSEDPSDIEFLAQLAQEFPSERRHRATSFSVSPKLIRPESDLRIGTAFNRKLSLQLGELRRSSPRLRTSRLVVTENERYSLPVGAERCQVDPLRTAELHETRASQRKSPDSLPTGSASPTESESGFSSMNSFPDVGLPLVNSTAIEEVSARSVLLKSMLHNSDYLNDSDHNSSVMSDVTLTGSPPRERQKRENNRDEGRRHSLSDVKLWQKLAQVQANAEASSANTPGDSAGNRLERTWHLTPEPKNVSPSLKVLWV